MVYVMDLTGDQVQRVMRRTWINFLKLIKLIKLIPGLDQRTLKVRPSGGEARADHHQFGLKGVGVGRIVESSTKCAISITQDNTTHGRKTESYRERLEFSTPVEHVAAVPLYGTVGAGTLARGTADARSIRTSAAL